MSDTYLDDKEKAYAHDQTSEPVTDGVIIVQDKEGEGLQRKLKNRHAQMISIGELFLVHFLLRVALLTYLQIGGVIGTGLFLGTATSLANGGPGGLLLGYLIVSSACVGGTSSLLLFNCPHLTHPVVLIIQSCFLSVN